MVLCALSLRKYLAVVILMATMVLSCQSDPKSTTTVPTVKVDTPALPPPAPSLPRTAANFTEYYTFELESVPYDPCELLSIHSINSAAKPFSRIDIHNRRDKNEKECAYIWTGSDGFLSSVALSIIGYNLTNAQLIKLMKADEDGVIESTTTGIRWIVNNKVLGVFLTGEVIKTVTPVTLKSHVRPLTKEGTK